MKKFTIHCLGFQSPLTRRWERARDHTAARYIYSQNRHNVSLCKGCHARMHWLKLQRWLSDHGFPYRHDPGGPVYMEGEKMKDQVGGVKIHEDVVARITRKETR